MHALQIDDLSCYESPDDILKAQLENDKNLFFTSRAIKKDHLYSDKWFFFTVFSKHNDEYSRNSDS